MSQAKDITDEVTAAIQYALIMQHATSGNFKEGGIMQNSEIQEARLHKGEQVINKELFTKRMNVKPISKEEQEALERLAAIKIRP